VVLRVIRRLAILIDDTGGQREHGAAIEKQHRARIGYLDPKSFDLERKSELPKGAFPIVCWHRL
jgi:hypothetical protein